MQDLCNLKSPPPLSRGCFFKDLVLDHFIHAFSERADGF